MANKLEELDVSNLGFDNFHRNCPPSALTVLMGPFGLSLCPNDPGRRIRSRLEFP
jgi:hypothetical protein